jgi:type IV secretion system T-DNA border endonuclease VirD2
MSRARSLARLFDSLGIFDSFEEFVHEASGGKAAPSSQVRPTIPGRRMQGTIRKMMGGGARGVISRVVRKVPEVMVKVSSVGKESGRVWAHLTYITRNGYIPAENGEGEVLSGMEDLKEWHAHWSEQLGKRRKNGKQTVHMVFSMPAGTIPERLKDAVRGFCAEVFGKHEYVFVLHTRETDPDPDAPAQPHVHLCVKARGKHGERLLHGRVELQAWREIFAEKLREHGIEAAATPRHVRGVVKKGMRQPVYQLAKANRSIVKTALVRDAARSVLNNSAESRPWEAKVAENQAILREGWAALADVLGKGAMPGDAELAQQIRAFVNDMPAPVTERQEVEMRMRTALRKDSPLQTSAVSRAGISASVSQPEPQTPTTRPSRPEKQKDQDR